MSTVPTVRKTGAKTNDGSQKLFQILLIFFGSLFMSSSQSVHGQSASPLNGPDFVLEKVASWIEQPNKDAELRLRDGSFWKLKQGTKDYEDQRDVITRAMRRDRELFLSGDKSQGTVEIVIDARHLAVEEMSAKPTDGRYSVLFQGPPSVYYLRTDRPWFGETFSLLQKSASGGATFSSPDLIVAIDPAHSEIVAVKPLQSGKPAASR
jgi:hypothetical protein